MDARQIEMASWKTTVAGLASIDPDRPLRLIFRGGANQIIGYRLYYMLRYAKKAGLRWVTLQSDGLFWIEEATDWLIESGVDRLLIDDLGNPHLAARIRALEEKTEAAGLVRPVVELS